MGWKFDEKRGKKNNQLIARSKASFENVLGSQM
jgi:hypothetical protein